MISPKDYANSIGNRTYQVQLKIYFLSTGFFIYHYQIDLPLNALWQIKVDLIL